MSSAKYQRRHYETVAAGLKAKNASDAEIETWIRKFAADNPRFRADFFRAAVRGGTFTKTGPRHYNREGALVTNTLTRAYRNRSRDLTDAERRSLKRAGFGRYGKRSRCKFGKKRVHGRWVCRRSRRK